MKRSKIVAVMIAGVGVMGAGAWAQDVLPARSVGRQAVSVLVEPGPYPLCPFVGRIPQPECLPGTVARLDQKTCIWSCGPLGEPSPFGPRPELMSRAVNHYGETVSQISKSLGQGDTGRAAEKLGAFFENSSGRAGIAASAVSVSAGRGLSAATLSASSSKAGIDAVNVPVPKSGRSDQPSEGGGFLAAMSAGALALVSFAMGGGKKEPRMVLASDEHTDPNSRRNNPQHDPDVARGWQQNQDSHRQQQNDSRNTTNHDFDVHKSGPGATSGGTEH